MLDESDDDGYNRDYYYHNRGEDPNDESYYLSGNRLEEFRIFGTIP